MTEWDEFPIWGFGQRFRNARLRIWRESKRHMTRWANDGFVFHSMYVEGAQIRRFGKLEAKNIDTSPIRPSCWPRSGMMISHGVRNEREASDASDWRRTHMIVEGESAYGVVRGSGEVNTVHLLR